MPVNKPLIPPPPLPPGTDLPGLLRSIADTELVSFAGLAVAVRTAADEIDRLRAALAAHDAKARHLRLLRTRFTSAESATPTEPEFRDPMNQPMYGPPDVAESATPTGDDGA